MELLLWRWSIGVQCASLAMIAVFFGLLSRSTRRVELGSWVLAWVLDLAALGASLFYWYMRPEGSLFRLNAGCYMVAKTAFVLLVIDGAWKLRRHGKSLPGRPLVGLALAVYGMVAAFVPSIDVLGLVQNLVMGPLFAIGGLFVFRKPLENGLAWLGAALLIRAVLSLVEGAIFGFVLAGSAAQFPALFGVAQSFLSAHSFIDTASEWLLALGCVLAFSDRVQRDLLQYNQDLLEAQEAESWWTATP
jgi:hypothetical protein